LGAFGKTGVVHKHIAELVKISERHLGEGRMDRSSRRSVNSNCRHQLWCGRTRCSPIESDEFVTLQELDKFAGALANWLG